MKNINKMWRFLWICVMMMGVGAVAVWAYEDGGRRDPFWRLVTPQGVIINYEGDLGFTDLVLEGLIMSGDEPMAVINGKILRQGDRIGPFVVRRIGKDFVELEDQEGVHRLDLNEEE